MVYLVVFYQARLLSDSLLQLFFVAFTLYGWWHWWRGVREEGSWGGKLNEVLDAVESAEADIQEDIEFALVQMKSETLNKVNDALVRLERGDYGFCYECGEEIAEKRLRALPFAVRCKDCEQARETAEQKERQAQRRGGASSLFLDM